VRLIGLAVALAVSLTLEPLAATAQQPGKVFRIGILSNVPLTDPRGAPLWGAFTEELRELGYVDARTRRSCIDLLKESMSGFRALPPTWSV
jgi:hypothetical protein